MKQSENRTRWERVLCRCRMHSMPLYIAPIHFLFLSLTNYGNSSQGEETSSHLQTPPWLSIPKYPLVKCCGAVSCPCQFSCICFLVPGSSLVWNQSFAVVYVQHKTWPDFQDIEKSAVSVEVEQRTIITILWLFQHNSRNHHVTWAAQRTNSPFNHVGTLGNQS